jgi:ABC-2 type transport system ATP-binding protein
MACIEARGLRKAFGTTVALDGVDLRVEEGRIVGLIGPNGAGKTTALNAILGLTAYQGELKVLGRDPWTEREQLMRDVCFVADVAVVPRWARVSQLLDYVAGVHPRFDRAKAEGFLAKTTIKRASKVRELSKGMVAQLHLALVMAIDARLLVLDEPTLGLDILYSKQFYDSLLNDYFDHSRTIVVRPIRWTRSRTSSPISCSSTAVASCSNAAWRNSTPAISKSW